MFRKVLMTLLVATALQAFAAVNFPFPQSTTYGGNILVASTASSAQLKARFTTWMAGFYREQGTEARIKFDDTTYTVSEGIGYGMLLMVYFSDNTPTSNYQTQFDKLWNYYKNRPGYNGIMNWKIQGFSTTCNQGAGNCNGATDGDVDVATALVLAYRQFGDAKYLTGAQALSSAIYANELDASKVFKPGDAWDSRKNPSYFSPAAVELFKSIDANPSRWDAVLTANYALLQSNANITTGLVSDWCTATGTPTYPTAPYNNAYIFNYDASRTPWRLAMAQAWFNQATAKTMNTKMGSWIRTKTANTPSRIRAGYNTSGDSLATYANSTFMGAFGSAVAGEKNASGQAYLNTLWTSMMVRNETGYFNTLLQLLNGLLIGGYMPQLSGGAISSSSSVVASSSSAISVATDLIDDLEDGDNVTKWGGEWYTYNDNVMVPDTNGLGASVITPLTSIGPPKVYFTPTAGGAIASTAYGAKITFSLNKGTFLYLPFVGIGFNLRADEAQHNLSSCTQIEYKYKGYGHRFRVESGAVTNSNFHGMVEPASDASWTTVSLTFAQLAQEDWGQLADVVIDKSRIKAFSWQIQDSTGRAGSLIIDDVKCVGGIPGPIPTSSGAVSSSSALSSSVVTSSSSLAGSSSSLVMSSSIGASSSATSSSSILVSSSAVVVSSSSSDVPMTVGTFPLWGVYVDILGSTVSPAPGTSPLKLEAAITIAEALMTILPEPLYDAANPPASSLYPFVGMLMEFKALSAPADLSAVTSISLTYRSAGNVRMALNQTGVPTGQEWGVNLTPAATWTTVSVPLSGLAQPDWVTAATAKNMKQTIAVKWELKEPLGAPGSIAVKNIVFNGLTLPIGATSSSSSRAVSSSSRAIVAIIAQANPVHLGWDAQSKSIHFQVETNSLVRVEVLDMFGRVETTPISAQMPAGVHNLGIQGVKPGVHLVRIQVGDTESVLTVHLR